MLKLESIAIAPDADEKGVEVQSMFFPDIFYRVRPIDYAPYQMGMAMRSLELGKAHGEEVPPSERSRVRAELVAKHILLGWRGFDVEYSTEAATEYLTNPAYRKLVDDIEFCASKAAQIEFEYVEEVAKNL